MPTKQNPRKRRRSRPKRKTQKKEMNSLTDIRIEEIEQFNNEFDSGRPPMSNDLADRRRGKAEKRGDEANPRGVAAGEGPVVDGEGDVEHVLVVDGARAANELLDEADKEEVENGADEEIGKERKNERGGGGV